MAALNTALAHKLKKVMETRTESPDMMVALQSLSEFYSDNTLSHRRNLRGEIEFRGLEICQEFLAEYGKLNEQLETVATDLDNMEACCNGISKRFETAMASTNDLIARTSQLKTEREGAEMRLKIVSSFHEHFQLSPEEVHTLRKAPISPAFFEVLARVQTIHSDCKTLLRTRHQKAGLEIMELMMMYQESAYERLYNWIRTQCGSMDMDNPDVAPLKPAIRALRERPALFRHCMDEISAARRTAVVRSFIAALTRGGPNGMPRPIEMHAHDPLRYVGDMLAWIHQTVATEHEMLSSLFEVGKKAPAAAAAAAPPATGEGDAPQQMSEADVRGLLDHVFDGVCRAFKVRVDQVLVAQPLPVVAYRLSNLLEFYNGTIGQFLGESASLFQTVLECKASCMQLFFNLLRNQADKLFRHPPSSPPDLSPPYCVQETLANLSEVMEIYEVSLVPEDVRERDFAPIMAATLDPLLQICSLSATGLDASDMAAYLINCLAAMQAPLSKYAFTQTRIELLNGQIEAHMDTLIQEEATFVLTACGLVDKIRIFQSQPEGTVLAQVPGMDPASLSSAMRLFHSALSQSLHMPHCDRLINSFLRTGAVEAVTMLIVNAYASLYDAIRDPANQYEAPGEIVPHSPDQVKLLLGVEEGGEDD